MVRDTVDTVLEELAEVLGPVEDGAVEALQARILAARRVFVAGAGRSGLMMRAFATRLMHVGLEAHVVGDATTPAISPEDLLVIGSGSGETASVQAVARRARQVGAALACVTVVPQSTIAKLASPVVELRAPYPKAAASPGGRERPRSIQLMGSLFDQALLILLDVVVLRVAQARGAGPEELLSRHTNLE